MDSNLKANDFAREHIHDSEHKLDNRNDVKTEHTYDEYDMKTDREGIGITMIENNNDLFTEEREQRPDWDNVYVSSKQVPRSRKHAQFISPSNHGLLTEKLESLVHNDIDVKNSEMSFDHTKNEPDYNPMVHIDDTPMDITDHIDTENTHDTELPQNIDNITGHNSNVPIHIDSSQEDPNVLNHNYHLLPQGCYKRKPQHVKFKGDKPKHEFHINQCKIDHVREVDYETAIGISGLNRTIAKNCLPTVDFATSENTGENDISHTTYVHQHAIPTTRALCHVKQQEKVKQEKLKKQPPSKADPLKLRGSSLEGWPLNRKLSPNMQDTFNEEQSQDIGDTTNEENQIYREKFPNKHRTLSKAGSIESPPKKGLAPRKHGPPDYETTIRIRKLRQSDVFQKEALKLLSQDHVALTQDYNETIDDQSKIIEPLNVDKYDNIHRSSTDDPEEQNIDVPNKVYCDHDAFRPPNEFGPPDYDQTMERRDLLMISGSPHKDVKHVSSRPSIPSSLRGV
ncbi:unnamed protein product, partial [Owenia fusiformis]